MKRVLIVLLFFIPASGLAQSTKVKEVSKPLTNSFDSSIGKLPSNFVGNTPEQIFLAINKMPTKQKESLVKDEFETTETFQKRVEEENKKKSELNSFLPQKQFVFVLNYQFSEYDADNQKMNIKTAFTTVNNSVKALVKNISESSYYNASNSFGVTVKVNKYLTTAYSIEFEGNNFSQLLPVTAQIAMDIPTAKLAKPNVRTLVIFEIVEPYQKNEITSTTPTLTSPIESITVFHTIIAKIQEVWFFDQSTGKIYFKQKIQD